MKYLLLLLFLLPCSALRAQSLVQELYPNAEIFVIVTDQSNVFIRIRDLEGTYVSPLHAIDQNTDESLDFDWIASVDPGGTNDYFKDMYTDVVYQIEFYIQDTTYAEATFTYVQCDDSTVDPPDIEFYCSASDAGSSSNGGDVFFEVSEFGIETYATIGRTAYNPTLSNESIEDVIGRGNWIMPHQYERLCPYTDDPYCDDDKDVMNYFLARQPGTTITNGLRTFDVDAEGLTVPATRTWRFNDVALRFDGSQFTVNGSLIADGMLFTASGTSWGGLYMSGSGGVSIYDSRIEDATTGIYAQNMNGLYLTGSTITGSTNYALHASSITGSEIINTRFENSGSHGVYISSGGLRLVGARIENNGSDGIHLSYANSLLMGGGGEPGYNVVTGNGGHGLYAYASSANLGEAPTVANPDGYAGYNSIYGNTGKDIYATSSSDVMAEENWWGESPPNTSHFYVSSNSSFDYAPWLTSDPNAGFGKAAYTASLETSGTASRTGQDEAAYPSGSNVGVDVRAAELSIGAFVGRVQALREKQGRAHAAAVLAEIAATPGHPMVTVAQLLRLGDLLYLRRTQEVVAAGEALLRQELDVEAQKIVARALLTAYWEQLGDETNAARMKGLLVRLGDLAAISGTLAPEIEAAAYEIEAAHAGEAASGKTEAMTVDGRLRVSTHPNPFNRELMIHYVLPEQGHVTLGLFDVTGRRVALLVDEAQAEGEHEAAFDAGELPSGVYLYRITTAGGTTSGVVLLTK